MRNSLLNLVELGSGGSEWLLTLRLNTTKGPVSLVSVYTPTLSTTPDAKDEIYENLASTILTIHSLEQLDWWPSCLTKDLLFADDATHTQQKLQSLMNPFSQGLWADHQPEEDKCNIWGKIHRHHQPSPSITTSLIPITSSRTLDKQSPITSSWTLRSIRGSERQLQHSLTLHFMCDQTPSWLWRQRWLCTMPAFKEPYMYHMAGRHGPHMPDGKRGSTSST